MNIYLVGIETSYDYRKFPWFKKSRGSINLKANMRTVVAECPEEAERKHREVLDNKMITWPAMQELAMEGFCPIMCKEPNQKIRLWIRELDKNAPFGEYLEYMSPEDLLLFQKNLNMDIVVDIEKRDKILFGDSYVPEYYRRHGVSRSFKGVTLEQLQTLLEQGFLDPNERRNNSPSIAEFMEYMKTHEGFTAHGFAFPAPTEKYSVSIQGLQKLDNVNRKDLYEFVNTFLWADELTCKDDELYCWYD